MQTLGQTAATSDLTEFTRRLRYLTERIEQSVYGKREQVQRCLVGLLAGGHLLLDDVPGVGKTTLARALAGVVRDGTTSRIQGTPDLLPSDIVGTSIYERDTGQFTFRPGPVVATIVLFDEINRCAPRTQSALLEAMQERRVTTFRHEERLPDPFMVIGTQNPQETLGTYPLPEAQLDRFLMRISLGYPDRGSARDMLKVQGSPARDRAGEREAEGGIPVAELRAMTGYAAQVPVADSVYDYLLDIVDATRKSPDIALGASPRASVELLRAARVNALVRWDPGRDGESPFLRPDDISEIAVDVLAHRIVLAARAGRSTAEAQQAVIRRIVEGVAVPQRSGTWSTPGPRRSHP